MLHMTTPQYGPAALTAAAGRVYTQMRKQPWFKRIGDEQLREISFGLAEAALAQAPAEAAPDSGECLHEIAFQQARSTRDQACRYLAATYGPSVWWRAPETFDNVLERWILALANVRPKAAEEAMARIEEMAAGRGR